MSIKKVKTETVKRYGFYSGFSGQNDRRNQNGICQNGKTGTAKRRNGTAKRQNGNGQNGKTASENRNGEMQNGEDKMEIKTVKTDFLITESKRNRQNCTKTELSQNGFKTDSKRSQNGNS